MWTGLTKKREKIKTEKKQQTLDAHADNLKIGKEKKILSALKVTKTIFGW